jgi:hypothetical protein
MRHDAHYSWRFRSFVEGRQCIFEGGLVCLWPPRNEPVQRIRTARRRLPTGALRRVFNDPPSGLCGQPSAGAVDVSSNYCRRKGGEGVTA